MSDLIKKTCELLSKIIAKQETSIGIHLETSYDEMSQIQRRNFDKIAKVREQD